MIIAEMVPWSMLGKWEARLSRWTSGRRRQAGPGGRCGTTGALSVLCSPLQNEGLQCQLWCLLESWLSLIKPLSPVKAKIKTHLPALLPPYLWPVSAFSLSSVALALSSILLCPLIHSLLKNLVEVSSLSPLGYPSDLFPDSWDQGSFISLFVPEI